MRTLLLASLAATACTAAPAGDVSLDPDELGDIPDTKADGIGGIPDVHCDGVPDAGPTTKFRHFSSKLASKLSARHRGVDLIATASASVQVIEGDLSYGVTDKALEDEDVDVFACRASQWRPIGSARTDGEGHFRIELTEGDRLPLGTRDLFVSVRGDRTGVSLLGFVANDGAPLAISDVDGTLTSSEAAFGATIVLGLDIGIHDHAAEAFQTVADRGYQPVYLTARSRAWTEVTRAWLAEKGMPRGPLRLSPHTILPGGSTVEFKAGTLANLAGFELAVGNGNRGSDIEAYQQAGVPGISIKLPEFEGEVADAIAAGEAFGFTDYAELTARFSQLPVR